MAAHRYWKLNILGIQPNGDDTTPPFQLYDVENGTPLNYTINYGEWRNNFNLIYDLGIAKNVVEYNIGSGNYPLEVPYNFNVSWSDNNINWTIIDTQSNVQWINLNYFKTFTLRYYNISGFVYNSNSLPVLRVINFHDRESGILLGTTNSDPSTGYYSMEFSSNAECYVVCLDDSPGIFENDMIQRVIPS